MTESEIAEAVALIESTDARTVAMSLLYWQQLAQRAVPDISHGYTRGRYKRDDRKQDVA